jgi:hypothetical protein
VINVRSVGLRNELDWFALELDRSPIQRRGNLQRQVFLWRRGVIPQSDFAANCEALLLRFYADIEVVFRKTESFAVDGMGLPY